jgi:hypothetical protein
LDSKVRIQISFRRERTSAGEEGQRRTGSKEGGGGSPEEGGGPKEGKGGRPKEGNGGGTDVR